MRTLNLLPDVTGYSVSDPNGHVHVKLLGGASRLRREYINSPSVVALQWTCGPEEFNYLQSFYRVQAEGTQPFLMSLILHHPTLTEHVCRFVPRTFQLASQQGDRYVVKAQIEADPLVPDEPYDEGLVTTFEAFGSEGPDSYLLLQTLVNVAMPNSIR